ncbi:MAG: nuclear transport factor 2 family protein [Pseudomonadota bacterium]
MTLPEQVVQRQLEAYNARDLQGWLATYHPEAEHYQLHGPLIAVGRDALGSRIRVRFQEPDLHARLLRRIVMGNLVVDHEEITRTFPTGRGSVEMLCVYEVEGPYIRKASFAVLP